MSANTPNTNMSVNNHDNQDLNSRISAWFEPFESLPPITILRRASSSFPSRANFGPGELSSKGAWKVGPGMRWYARKWDTDEAANARLLDRLREVFPYLAIVFDRSGGIEVEAGGVGDLVNFATTFKTQDRKTAVVLAFCKWAGIETEGL